MNAPANNSRSLRRQILTAVVPIVCHRTGDPDVDGAATRRECHSQ